MNYPVAIHKDEYSDYGVIVPDLPGCFSAGETIEEAVKMAHEAIQTHIEGMLLDGDVLPPPVPIEQHQMNPEFKGAIWLLIPVDLEKISGKAKRINITIPEPALARIDAFVKDHGETRSGFLTRAALQVMQ
ncbi:MAG: type II toxin-antitoxin system HicB family antitoxin [Magnetococcales bacterium]|nr:type II toxin-antitoxin system HicB family antitoxin [Magnetococcales bacterium]